MLHPTNRLWLAVIVLLVALPLARARAQSIGVRPLLSIESSGQRLDFPDEITGSRAGPFQLLPSAAVALAYDTNVFASGASRQEEALSVSDALLHFENDPGAFSLESEAFVRARRFLHSEDQDTTEFGASAISVADVDGRNQLSARGLAQRRFESRTEIETPDTRAVSFYKEWRGDLSYLHTFNRLSLRSTLRGRKIGYEDASQTFRDQAFYGGTLRGSYLLRNGLSLIGTGLYRRDDYLNESPFVASSETVGSMIGARLEIPEVLDFELTGGVFRREFAQQLGSISGASIRGSVIWRPTRLTTVQADITRDDAPTRIVGAFGKIRTDATLEVSHEYSRRLNLYVRGQMVVDEFDTIQRTDTTYLTQLGAVCLLTRRYVVAAEYDYGSRSSDSVDESFARHVTSVSLLARF